jgi:hypothetical protein
MTAEVSTGCEVELRSMATGALWVADVEAQGAEHLRVRVRPDEIGVMPVLPAGTALECAMDSQDGRYFVSATAIAQQSDLIWLEISPMWRRTERRAFRRYSGAFQVHYFHDQRHGIAACLDISAGGCRLRVKSPLPVQSSIELVFTLPGTPLPMRTQARILHVRPSDGAQTAVDLGIKFTDLAVEDGARLARYCN